MEQDDRQRDRIPGPVLETARLVQHSVGRKHVLRTGQQEKYFTFYDANMHAFSPPASIAGAFEENLPAGLGEYSSAVKRAASYNAEEAFRVDRSAYTPYSYSDSTRSHSGLGIATGRDSLGNSYTTSSQQIENLNFSNTFGTNGYRATSTTQRLGTFDYINGISSNGSFSETRQRIGDFDFTHLTTSSGQWNGTGNQIGNVTFHNFSGPSGQTVTGTSIRIGDFIFSNLR